MDEADIKQTLELGGLKIIRRYPSDKDLMSYPRAKLNRNIEAYDCNGNLAWVIQECPVGGEEQDKAYMNIWVENKKLLAGNWLGLDFIVNIDNGTVAAVNLGVRPW